MAKPVKKLAFIMTVLVLVSCGYHMRGAVNIPEDMKKVFVRNGSPQLISGFHNVFQYSAATLVGSPSDAGVIVNVLEEEMRRRAVSLSGTGKANEFELNYLLDYELLNAAGAVLSPKQTVELTRNYFNEQQQVIGKANEERIIREEMYLQAVQAIIRKAQVVLQKNG